MSESESEQLLGHPKSRRLAGYQKSLQTKDMDRIFRWLFGRTLIFILLVIGLAACAFLGPQASKLRGDAESFLWNPEVLPGKIKEYVALQNNKLEQATTDAKKLSANRIKNRIFVLKSDRKRAITKRDAAASGFLAGINPNQILEVKKAEIEISAIDKEIGLLDSAVTPRQMAEQATSFFRKYPNRPTEAAIKNADRLCVTAKTALNNFKQKSQIEIFSREFFIKRAQNWSQIEKFYVKM